MSVSQTSRQHPTGDQLDDLVKRLKYSKQQREAFKGGGDWQLAKLPMHTTLLLGAGASLSSGLPKGEKVIETAKALAQAGEIEADLTKVDDYQTLMTKLTRSDVRLIFEGANDNPRPSWGYMALAGLIEAGYFTCILNLNFDSMLAKAATSLGLYS